MASHAVLCRAIVLLVKPAVGADAVFPAIIDITSERDALAKIGLPLVLENVLVVNGAPAKETLPITAHDYFRIVGRESIPNDAVYYECLSRSKSSVICSISP